jgi:hypothetical protein
MVYYFVQNNKDKSMDEIRLLLNTQGLSEEQIAWD